MIEQFFELFKRIWIIEATPDVFHMLSKIRPHRIFSFASTRKFCWEFSGSETQRQKGLEADRLDQELRELTTTAGRLSSARR